METNHNGGGIGSSSSDNESFYGFESQGWNGSDFYNKDSNRAIDEINKNKLSTDLLHITFKKTKWYSKDFESAKEMGLTIKRGNFTKEEERILTTNWQQFCDDFVVNNPHIILGYFRYNRNLEKSERKAAKDLIKRSEMLLRLTKDLPNRTVSQVYQKARKLFSGLNKSANLTKEQTEAIIELGKKGEKSRLIAEKFFADIRTVEEIINQKMNKNRIFHNKFKWSEDEEQLFIETIKNIMEENNITNVTDIPWADVSTILGTRNNHQCRDHFFTVTFFKMFDPDSGIRKWSHKETQQLIYVLFKSKYDNELQIDWDFIKEIFNDFLFNQILRNWNYNKRTVADYQTMDYRKLITHLYDKHIKNGADIQELEEFYRQSLK